MKLKRNKQKIRNKNVFKSPLTTHSENSQIAEKSKT